jgi:hypothetical protein
MFLDILNATSTSCDLSLLLHLLLNRLDDFRRHDSQRHEEGSHKPDAAAPVVAIVAALFTAHRVKILMIEEEFEFEL